jgi:hypothetical protein
MILSYSYAPNNIIVFRNKVISRKFDAFYLEKALSRQEEIDKKTLKMSFNILSLCVSVLTILASAS